MKKHPATLERALAGRLARKPVKGPNGCDLTSSTSSTPAAFLARPTPPLARTNDVARAMQAAQEYVEARLDYRRGRPMISQSIAVEEAYWNEVWRQLNRPDPGLSRRVAQL